VRLTNAMFGWMPGGLALVCLAACAFFTAFTGASGVTIIALGAILYPALKQDGYGDRFNLGLVTSSGSLGLLFAPSLPLILYGVVAEVSIDDLFRAGILPGIAMLVMLSLGVAVANRRAGRNLFGLLCRLRSRCDHGAICVHRRGPDQSRDCFQGPAADHA
jgi:TRAP-type C4-dicarboxylate transport system permease large subunit